MKSAWVRGAPEHFSLLIIYMMNNLSTGKFVELVNTYVSHFTSRQGAFRLLEETVS
jgi:hypothetical protein